MRIAATCPDKRSLVRVPCKRTRTARTIASAALKLADSELDQLIEFLIEELDRRTGDPDLEPEPEEEDL